MQDASQRPSPRYAHRPVYNLRPSPTSQAPLRPSLTPNLRDISLTAGRSLSSIAMRPSGRLRLQLSNYAGPLPAQSSRGLPSRPLLLLPDEAAHQRRRFAEDVLRALAESPVASARTFVGRTVGEQVGRAARLASFGARRSAARPGQWAASRASGDVPICGWERVHASQRDRSSCPGVGAG